ncbi:unnamed protein product [Cyprideis torosa]|uniref:Uncharacterized protein n=1 Tax=Cyprideis torosa TaxID=163714 RepID=A0A7R8ZP34_9CRUS|nr:unnamed protein product [Cyprideis torosa]CAG0897834.1 unnamed protein product [Cyprideis torosa]
MELFLGCARSCSGDERRTPVPSRRKRVSGSVSSRVDQFGRLHRVAPLLNDEEDSALDRVGKEVFLWTGFSPQNLRRMSEVHLAALNDDSERIRKLAKHSQNILKDIPLPVPPGLLVEETTEEGETPLYLAAINSCFKAAKALLDYGADPNTRCSHGYTALHGAVFGGHRDLLRLLLAAGAHIGLHDEWGKLPRDWAFRQQNSELRHRSLNILDEMESNAQWFAASNGMASGREAVAAGAVGRGYCVTPPSKHGGGSSMGWVWRQAASWYPVISEEQLDPIPGEPECLMGRLSFMMPHRWNGMKVSVRFLKSPLQPDLLLDEFQALRQLHHPNLLLLMGTVLSPLSTAPHCLVFEHVEMTLHSLLHTERLVLPMLTILSYGLQLSQAVGYLHQLEWVHGALSSFGVFVAAAGGRVKLGGFEYAVASQLPSSEKIWRHSQLLRHPDLHPWLSPEVLLHGCYPSAASDIFALCLIMLEMMTGSLPRRGRESSCIQWLKSVMSAGAGEGGVVCVAGAARSVIEKPLFDLLSVGLRPDPGDRDLEVSEVIGTLEILSESMIRSSQTDPVKEGRRSHAQTQPIGRTQLALEGKHAIDHPVKPASHFFDRHGSSCSLSRPFNHSPDLLNLSRDRTHKGRSQSSERGRAEDRAFDRELVRSSSESMLFDAAIGAKEHGQGPAFVEPTERDLQALSSHRPSSRRSAGSGGRYQALPHEILRAVRANTRSPSRSHRNQQRYVQSGSKRRGHMAAGTVRVEKERTHGRRDSQGRKGEETWPQGQSGSKRRGHNGRRDSQGRFPPPRPSFPFAPSSFPKGCIPLPGMTPRVPNPPGGKGTSDFHSSTPNQRGEGRTPQQWFAGMGSVRNLIRHYNQIEVPCPFSMSGQEQRCQSASRHPIAVAETEANCEGHFKRRHHSEGNMRNTTAAGESL